MARMDSDKHNVENFINVFCRKVAHIIVESRLGKKIVTPCKEHAEPSDWFNLSTEDMPEVVSEVRRLLSSESTGTGRGISPGHSAFSFCVEISLRTSDGVSLVLEHWSILLNPETAVIARPPPLSHTVNQLGILLKSLVVTTRLTTGYRLSRQQSPESHIILYKIFLGQPDLGSLGDGSGKLVVGEVVTPLCGLSLVLNYRTRLAISSQPESILMKSDHFRPEISPRVRRLTAFTERRHSDSVDMVGVSSSSSSNMDTKMAGGSSTDSEQKRRVAAFVDDSPGERSGSGDVPFSRLLATGCDVSMNESQCKQATTVPSGTAPVTGGTAPVPGGTTLLPGDTSPVPGGTSLSQPEPAAAEPTDDFVMVELRTPFSEGESDGELGQFFRRCWTAPLLSSAPDSRSTAPPISDSPGSAAPPILAGTPSASDSSGEERVSLSQRLHDFQIKSQEYDDLIAQLSRTGLETRTAADS